MEDRVTDAELEEFERNYTLADTDQELDPETYPGLFNISAAVVLLLYAAELNRKLSRKSCALRYDALR